MPRLTPEQRDDWTWQAERYASEDHVGWSVVMVSRLALDLADELAAVRQELTDAYEAVGVREADLIRLDKELTAANAKLDRQADIIRKLACEYGFPGDVAERLLDGEDWDTATKEVGNV